MGSILRVLFLASLASHLGFLADSNPEPCESQILEKISNIRNQLHATWDTLSRIKTASQYAVKNMSWCQDTFEILTHMKTISSMFSRNISSNIARWDNKGCPVRGNFHVNSNCSISQCGAKGWHLYHGSRAPHVYFSKLVAKGCMFEGTNRTTWEAARTFCRAEGGDLFVAGDLRGMSEYFSDSSSTLWVGVKDKLWLDGRPVASDEWNLGEAERGKRLCGAWDHMEGRTKLNQDDCSVLHYPLCQQQASHLNFIIH